MSQNGRGGALPGPLYRVLTVPADRLGGSAEQDYAAVLPAVLDAARAGRPLVAGWLCAGGGAPLQLITSAGPLAGPGPAGRGALMFPWGARGVPLTADAQALLHRLSWVPCPGRQAPGLAAEPAPAGAAATAVRYPDRPAAAGAAAAAGTGYGAARPSLFESALLTLIGRPFGWLVVAEAADLAESETAELRSRLTVLRRLDDERARFDADRAARRLAELDAYREAGLWRVRVLAGAADRGQLALIAPVLVGSADLGSHPYRLRAVGGSRELAVPAAGLGQALAAESADPVDGAAVPFAATAGVLTALAGLPRREVPGVRILDAGYFDVTSEAGDAEAGSAGAALTAAGRGDASGGPAVSLGAILDGQDRPVGWFRVRQPTLNRHALVAGATGSGKSHTIRHLLTGLTAAGLPWLVVEPVKSEYAMMPAQLRAAHGAGAAPVTVINPADPGQVPLAVNPLQPEPGYPVQAHIDMVRALFLAAFEAREPFPQIIAQALQRVYEDCGWDPVTGGGLPGLAAPPAVPTLAGLEAAALRVITDVGYGRELQADVRGFVTVRLRSLRGGSAGRFFEGGHPADIAALLRRNVVLAIEDVANDEDKAFLIGTLIIRITEHLRLRSRSRPAAGLRHVIVIEEAHRLLRAGKEGASAHAVELFAGLLAEIRAYGEGLLIAEQIPAKLVPDAVKNTALKIMHRLPARDDRDLVGATMNLDHDQSRQVVSFPPGVAAVFADGMDRPLRVRVPYGRDAERPAVPAGPPPGSADGEPAVPAGASPGSADGEPAVPAGPLLPPLAGRRSAACGPACRGAWPCTAREMRFAGLHALAPDGAWLRVWIETLLLALLTESPPPTAPAPLAARWARWPDRIAQCALATVIDRSVRRRAAALIAHLDPDRLAGAAAARALRALNGGGPPPHGDPDWVIPQLCWLSEMERACPLAGPPPDPAGPAPLMTGRLAGLPDATGATVWDRVTALRRHPLSMELAANREAAWGALLGDDDQREFCADLALLMVGAPPGDQLIMAAAAMEVSGWLPAVLSWPRRFIIGEPGGA